MRNSNVVSMEKLLFFIHGMSITDQAAAHNVGAEHRLQFNDRDCQRANPVSLLLRSKAATVVRDAQKVSKPIGKRYSSRLRRRVISPSAAEQDGASHLTSRFQKPRKPSDTPYPERLTDISYRR